MKILMAHKFFHPAGGPETVMSQDMDYLRSMGHTVIPFSMQHPKNLKTKYEKYFVSNVDYNSYSKLPWNLARTTLRMVFNFEAKKKMEKLICDAKPDVAHLHNIYHQLSPSILVPLKKHNIPVVMSLHDFKLVCPNYVFLRDGQVCEECKGRYFYKAIKYKCLKGSYLKSTISAVEMYVHKLFGLYESNIDRFIVLSGFSKERFVRYGLPEKKIVFLPNYVNVPNLKGNSSKKRYILFLGRLSDKNGASNLICAMKKLPNVKLKLAGEGEQEKVIRDYIEENKIKNVEMVGFLTGDKLKRTIANCSFLVFPNNYYHLCPMSILESFSYAKPVVGANLGSVPELVEDNKTGLLFEPGSTEDLAKKIEYLYKRPQLVKKLGQNALNKVRKDYSKERYYQELLRLYEDLIEKKKGGNYVNTKVDMRVFNKLSLRVPTKGHMSFPRKPAASPLGRRKSTNRMDSCLRRNDNQMDSTKRIEEVSDV